MPLCFEWHTPCFLARGLMLIPIGKQFPAMPTQSYPHTYCANPTDPVQEALRPIMNLPFLIRAACALLSVIVPMWLTTLMPADSAFFLNMEMIRFSTWQWIMVAGSLMISLVMARVLTRQ